MNKCFIIQERSHFHNTREESPSRLHTSIYIKKRRKEKRMKISSIYKQLDEYLASACIAKTIH